MAFKNLSKLSKDLQDGIKRLEFGEMNSSEIDQLADDARELHERLTILRYKYHESQVRIEESKENLKGEIPVLFRMEEDENGENDISNNQTSLIDAIEEVSVEEDIKNPDPVVDTKKEEAPVVKPKQAELVASPKKSSKNNSDGQISMDDSLVEKLENAPIANLKKEISLNLKFRFINELFDGNADEYNKAIDLLDGMESLDEAKNFLSGQVKSDYDWNEEKEEVGIFDELLQRRYI